MLPHDTREKIKDITSGNVIEGAADSCTTVRNYLCASFATSTTVKANFESQQLVKEEQAKLIEAFCRLNGLWIRDLPPANCFLTRGGEASVYLDADGVTVTKLNDAVYYATWLEFFNSVVLHNLIFPNTSYTFLGLARKENVLYAVLKQPFIIANGQADIDDIRAHLLYNGFENTRRNDYKHPQLGLLLEDMHDENVLANSETLFFIDTVFYTVSPV